MYPSAPPAFPGPSLKYMRLSVYDAIPSPSIISFSNNLSSILSRASHLELELICGTNCTVTFEEIVEQFPSQVKCYDEFHCGIPVDELYERACMGVETRTGNLYGH